MKTYNEIKTWMKENGYKMEKAISGYWYCTRTDEEGVVRTVWMDSACEDAYELETATFVAYSIITED